jgi:hypothetical protein
MHRRRYVGGLEGVPQYAVSFNLKVPVIRVRSEVLTALKIKITVLWHVTPCILIERHRCVGRTCP